MAKVCKDRFIKIAYKLDLDINNVTNQMIHWDLGYPFTPPWKYEILDYFFKNNGLTPIFLECNDTSGVLNKNTGEWNGCVGMVDSLR